MASRQARTVAALVELLQALPDEDLEEVLARLGIEDEKRGQAVGKPPGRCYACGQPWFQHKRLADRPEDGHPWDSGHRETTPSPGLHRPSGDASKDYRLCKVCHYPWPCPTFEALAQEAAPEGDAWDPAQERGNR